MPGFFASLWYGLWVPKGTPKDIIAKLNATMVQLLADPTVKQRFEDLGIQIAPHDQQSPEALRAFQKAEMPNGGGRSSRRPISRANKARRVP